MAWTYSGNPAASSLDAVRFLIGDTVDTKQILQDEEIEWLLTQQTNVYLAAALAADGVVASLVVPSGIKTKTVGALSISYSDEEKAKEYRKLAASLRVRAAVTSTFVPYSGGISKDDKLTREQDTDWDKPAFSRGMHDYPGADLKTGEINTTST